MARILFAGLATMALLRGQQEAPVFRAGTRLVEVTVTVLDKKGRGVAGLAPDHFTVFDGGKPRPIAFFRYEGLEEDPVPRPGLDPGVFTNRVERAGGPPRGITALVLDVLNTEPRDSAAARAQSMRYLRALAPQSRLAIYVMGREMRVLHDFTNDTESLRARLKSADFDTPPKALADLAQQAAAANRFLELVRDPSLRAVWASFFHSTLKSEATANSAVLRERMEQSLASLEALGRHLGGIPGRKNLVWITGGLSIEALSGTIGRERAEARFRGAARRLAQQNITLYIVSARGVGPQTPNLAMSLMASVTGGRHLYNTNDLAAGFQQAVADLHGSYTLGFYAPEEADNQWHELKVRVKHPDVTLRHREGYRAEIAPARQFDWKEETWQAMISNPLGSSVIPLTARCRRVSSGDLALALEIDPRNLHSGADGETFRVGLQVVIAERSAEGRARTIRGTLTATVDRQQGQRIPHEWQWRPAEDTRSVRVIVRDRKSGQYGTLDVPLGEIPVAPKAVERRVDSRSK